MVSYKKFLTILVDHPDGLANFEIARKMGVRGPKTQGIITHMLARGYIDRKYGRYIITDKGQKKLKAKKFEVV